MGNEKVFVGIVKRGSKFVVLLREYDREFVMDKKSLKERIKYLEMLNIDSSKEEVALKELEEKS